MKPLEFKRALRRVNMTQKDFGTLVGYSEQQVSRMATGQWPVPKAVLVILNLLISIEDAKQ